MHEVGVGAGPAGVVEAPRVPVVSIPVWLWSSPLPPGIHRDTEEEALVLEATGAEASPNISKESCAGHAGLPSPERVGRVVGRDQPQKRTTIWVSCRNDASQSQAQQQL